MLQDVAFPDYNSSPAKRFQQEGIRSFEKIEPAAPASANLQLALLSCGSVIRFFILYNKYINQAFFSRIIPR